MLISWVHLLPALVLLFFPLDRALGEKVRVRTYEGIRKLEPVKNRRPWWWLPVVWADPVRAYAGALLLTLSFAAVPKAQGLAKMLPLLATAGTLFVATWVQMRTKREQGAMLAPLGFLSGVVLALLTWKVAVPALILGLSSIFAFRALAVFFILTAGAAMVIGYFFMGKSLWLFATVGILGAPVLISLLQQGYFGFPSRR